VTQNLEAIRRFILGGMAIFTVVSKKSGDRKTFRVRAAEDVDGSGRPHGWYVDLLIGPNNLEDYRYIGFMWERAMPKAFSELRTKLNKHGYANEAFSAFVWLTAMINQYIMYNAREPAELAQDRQDRFERMCEFHHAGMCSRCGRTLTDPESIELGIGPICREKAA
jgi:hypothetical protein